jgi:sugar O-acyltransferase (sialic acid O-acetyltransferase NeuD family)
VATDLYIVGTRGLAKEAAQLARRLDPEGSRWPCIHYVTADPSELGQPRPFGVIDTLDEALTHPGAAVDVVIGIGQPLLRRRIAISLRTLPHLSFPNLLHPRVELDPKLVRIGIGNMIAQGVVLTCDIELGDFNLLNWNVTVGHDCRIGSYNVINPGSSVSGNVTVGDACLIGTGARILETLRVADDLVLGAGAVLTRSIDVANTGTYVGVPASRVPA